MCSNPTGGHIKMTGLTEELLRLNSADSPNEKILWLATICDAANNYLLWGLGENGTSAQQFSDAYTYFFKARSDNPDSWVGKRRLREMCTGVNGKRSLRQHVLSEDEMRTMTFDQTYRMARLDEYMPIERFLKVLLENRRTILRENKEQIDEYLDSLRQEEAARVGAGAQLILRTNAYDQQSVLLHPDSPAQVAELIYLPSTPRATKTIRKSRQRLIRKKT